MQVSRISIRNRYDTGYTNTGSHTLIINGNNAHTDITLSCSCLEKGKCSHALVYAYSSLQIQVPQPSTPNEFSEELLLAVNLIQLP